VTADSLAANNIVLGTYRISPPRMPSFLLRQPSRKRSTRTLINTSWSRSSDEGEIFNAYHEVASIRAKDEFLIPSSTS